MLRLYIFLASILGFHVLYATVPDFGKGPLVTLRQGVFIGNIENNVNVWKGIRYAQPPIGRLRFKAPQPLPAGNQIAQATEFGNIEAQSKNPLRGNQTASEDCLFLNIWSSTKPGNKKPVMVWVHGGGFVVGSGSDNLYDGSRIAENGDMVVVTFNYRLGPFGFLNLRALGNDSLKFETNLGLRDQLAALKWVKENISAFGGDTSNITVAGESAGGTSVLALMVSPLAKGLFQKAIVESGPPEGVNDIKESLQLADEYLRMLGVSKNNIGRLFTLPSDSFLEVSKRLFEKDKSMLHSTRLFRPVIGTDFLPMGINEALTQGAAKGITLMIGTNKDECNLFAKLKGNTPSVALLTAYLTESGFRTPQAIRTITSAYENYPSRKAILAILTDGVFQMPSLQSAAAQSKFTTTYNYRFDWSSSTLRALGLGACHGLEVPFVFGSFNSKVGRLVKSLSNRRRVKLLSGKMQSAWINFMRSGNPEIPSSPWVKFDTANNSTLIIDNKFGLISGPVDARQKAWENEPPVNLATEKK